MHLENHQTAARERAAIDALFEGMEVDEEFLAEGVALSEEMAEASWEALLLSEAED